jgi:hypothetical protein
LIAVRARASEDWVIVLERCEGYGRSFKVQRYVYAENLPSGRRDDLVVERWAALEDAPQEAPVVLIEPADYWTKIDNAPAQAAVARAVLAAHPDRVWPPIDELLAALGFQGATPLVVATSFQHTDGPDNDAPAPSEVATYQSLAEAVVANDASKFTPGADNLDPALHLAPEEEQDEDEDDDDDE